MTAAGPGKQGPGKSWNPGHPAMLPGMPTRAAPRRYDHRLVARVRETGNASLAVRLSAAAAFFQRRPRQCPKCEALTSCPSCGRCRKCVGGPCSCRDAPSLEGDFLGP